MEKVIEKITKKDLVEYMNEHEFSGNWDGGGDSGSYNVFIDGIELEYTDCYLSAIYKICDIVLQYGSWAGEFSANGEIRYDKETKIFSFEGIEHSDEYYEVDVKFFQIDIPDDVFPYIDSINLYAEPEAESMVKINITNGIFTSEMEVFEKELNEKFNAFLENDDLDLDGDERIVRLDEIITDIDKMTSIKVPILGRDEGEVIDKTYELNDLEDDEVLWSIEENHNGY